MTSSLLDAGCRGRSGLRRICAGWPPRSGREQLDGLEVGDVAADPLAGVELHEGLGAVGIAQRRDADAIDDGVTHLEVAEGDRQLGRADGVHIGGLAHLITKKDRRLARLLVLLPDVTALAVLQQHDLADRGALHQPI